LLFIRAGRDPEVNVVRRANNLYSVRKRYVNANYADVMVKASTKTEQTHQLNSPFTYFSSLQGEYNQSISETCFKVGMTYPLALRTGYHSLHTLKLAVHSAHYFIAPSGQ
jgi:hypothetical protein